MKQSYIKLSAMPGPGWEKIFNQIEAGQDAQVCFPVGTYPLTNPALIQGKSHLKLSGSGSGTQFLAPGLEAGLVFDDCLSVLIRDIYVETSYREQLDRAGIAHLNGALTILNCPEVNLEQVGLKCGTRLLRTATCLTIRNEPDSINTQILGFKPGLVRIQSCNFQIGNQQQGILLVNVGTALVEHNILESYNVSEVATTPPTVGGAPVPQRFIAAQGITIGGQVASDVRILNNTLRDVVQGIHVGLSHHHTNLQQLINQALNITVGGNTIDVVLPIVAAKEERYGIFVGNCQSLLIENNNLRLTRLDGARELPIDGIRVEGELGERVMITKNYAASSGGKKELGFSVGIHVLPEQAKPDTAQWVVMWNVAPSQSLTVSVENGAVDVNGTNTP